jgi:transmembrane sensor
MFHPGLIILFDQHVKGQLSPSQEKEFQELVSNADNKQSLQDLLDAWIADKEPDASLSAESRDAMLQAIFQASPGTQQPSARVRKIYWLRRAAVAAVLIVMATGSYWFFSGTKEGSTAPQIAQHVDVNVSAPAGVRAVLTLADGQKLTLDSIADGRLTMQGNMQVIKTAAGGVTYAAAASAGPGSSPSTAASPTAYNILSNPRGSKVVSVRLSDGTTVWLNNESTLRYPVAFTGTERRVEVTGEAYFEVAHDAMKKFSVTSGTVTTEVLGTHFNINSFEDEGSIKVTLLEGAVRVRSAAQQKPVILKPGQQARSQADGALQTKSAVDPEGILAWKNGLFQMKGTDLAALLRQLSRWYDIEVSYTGPLPQKSFGGSIDRNVNLSDVLKALEQYGIRSRMEGGKVIIQ